MARDAGISLIELLAAIAIVALLSGIAVPALDRVMLNARRAAGTGELLRAAWFARVAALQRGRPVLLCASASASSCDGDLAAWNAYWLVVAADEPTRVLRKGRGPTDPRARVLSNRTAFRFEADDRRSTNGTLAWCDRRGAAAARAIVISPTGRPRLEHGSGSLACPAP